MQYIAAPRRRTAGNFRTSWLNKSPRLWKPCRFTVLEMCFKHFHLMSNTCLQTWKIKDICRQYGHEINLRWFVVHSAHVAYESSNMHVHQSSQISGQGKTCTDYWEYMFKKTVAQSNHSKYCVFYLNMYNLFSLPLSLSLSLHLHGYHTSISLQIVWQPQWIHNQSLTLIFLTLQQGLKGTELIWIISILTVLPYSKAENAQAK